MSRERKYLHFEYKWMRGWVVDVDYEADKSNRRWKAINFYYDGDFYILWLWCFAITLTNSHHCWKK